MLIIELKQNSYLQKHLLEVLFFMSFFDYNLLGAKYVFIIIFGRNNMC